MVRFTWALFVFVLVTLPDLAFGAIYGLGNGGVRLAYIDPGTGSMLIQALVATVAGLAVTIRLYWTKIKSMLGKANADDEEDPDADDE